MKYRLSSFFVIGALVSVGTLLAQTPLAESSASAIDATVGNQVLQLRYLGQSPISQAPGNLDYGVLLTENREFVASAALMFDTNFVPLPRLRLQLGAQANRRTTCMTSRRVRKCTWRGGYTDLPVIVGSNSRS